MKIQAKLILFALLCSILPLLATFVMSFNAIEKSLSRTVQQNLLSQATEQLESIQHELASHKHILGTLSRMSTARDVSNADLSGNLQKDIDTFAKRTPLFHEIVATDDKGRVIAGNIRKFVNTNFSGDLEYEAPQSGEAYDGSVKESMRLKKVVATQSMPIYHRWIRGKIIGTMIGAIDWEMLQKDLAAKTVFGHAQGQDRQVVLQSLETGNILYGTEGAQIPGDVLSNIPDDLIQEVSVGDHEYLMVSIDSTRKEVTDGSSRIEEYRDPQWRLHVLLDKKIAFSSIAELKSYFILAGGMVLVLVLVLGALISRSILIPVRALATGAKHLSNGDYHYELAETKAKDEINQLTQSFNTMRVAIRSKEQELVNKTEVAEQAARLKGEFLANMSHEVRTPINGVLGMTELLLNTPLDKTQNRYANTISRSGQALLAVINDILDFSKIEAGKLELSDCAFDLRDLVEDVVEMVAENAFKKGVEVALHMPPESHVAFNGDSARLRQVLLNLLSNAVKFTEEGEVKLLVKCGKPENGVTPVSFKVVDTGIGIPAESQSKIFDSFVQADGSTTREFGGTGLGLAISSKLVSLMKGQIGVSSVPGEGSTFWFEVELEELCNSVVDAWRAPDALKGKKIIIVDDNQTNREILETQVSYWGAEPIAVESAVEALQKLAEVSGTEDSFDAAILDMHMPVMNGMELAEVLHEKQVAPNTRLVLLSSACDNLDLEYCRSVGIHSLANKPIRQPDLYNCLTAIVNKDSKAQMGDKQVSKKIESSTLTGHVLLAEDNPVNQDMMMEMLRLIGLTVRLAVNGEEVLKAYKEEYFDLILMDCQMPVLDGFAATRQLREYEVSENIERRMPIIALTANAMEGDKERCLDSGMDDYLTKPVSSSQLKETVGGWLGQEPVEVEEELTQPEEPVVAPSTPADAQDSKVATTEVVEQPSVASKPELTIVSNEEAKPKVEFDYAESIDDKVFTELYTMCQNASANFYTNLLSKYDASSLEDLEAIADGIKANDTEVVRLTAHRLKSSSASWGGKKLAAHLQSLETAGADKDISGAGELLELVKQERELLLTFLRSKDIKAA